MKVIIITFIDVDHKLFPCAVAPLLEGQGTGSKKLCTACQLSLSSSSFPGVRADLWKDCGLPW